MYFAADVFESSDKSERVLVAISTSGVIFMFRHLKDTLARALSRSSLVRPIGFQSNIIMVFGSLTCCLKWLSGSG